MAAGVVAAGVVAAGVVAGGVTAGGVAAGGVTGEVAPVVGVPPVTAGLLPATVVD